MTTESQFHAGWTETSPLGTPEQVRFALSVLLEEAVTNKPLPEADEENRKKDALTTFAFAVLMENGGTKAFPMQGEQSFFALSRGNEDTMAQFSFAVLQEAVAQAGRRKSFHTISESIKEWFCVCGCYVIHVLYQFVMRHPAILKTLKYLRIDALYRNVRKKF